MSLRTRILDQDDSLRLARNVSLSANQKTIIAPRRALSASQGKYSSETFLKNHSIRGLIEVYRHLNREKIQKMMMDNGEIDRFSYGLSSSLRTVNHNEEIIIGTIEYDSRAQNPNSPETELLLDLLNNPQFDIITPPIISKIPRESYTQFIDEFIDVLNSSSFHPTLAPLIPHYSRIDIPHLFEYYTRQDAFAKNIVCVDFNGSNPISQYTFVSMIVRECRMLERQFGHSVFLHAINLKYGKATKKMVAVPAKDLLIYTMGFNSFGANHKILRIPNSVGQYELKTKLLNRDDYGYYSIGIAGKAINDRNLYEIRLQNVLSNPKYAKLFNAERQSLESNRIRETIRDHEYGNYLQSKSHIGKQETILRKISKVEDFAMQQRL